MTVENFKDHPETLGERRSRNAENGALWSPRDALICTLRMIDSGELDPAALVVCWAEKTDSDGIQNTGFRSSAPDGVTACGLLTMTVMKVTGRV